MAAGFHELQNFIMHGFRRAVSIDNGDTLGLGSSEAEIPLADLFIKLAWLALHTVKLSPGGMDALPSGGGFEIEKDREVRQRAANSEGIDGIHGLQRQTTGDALIHGGGVEEAVENDKDSLGEQWSDFFSHNLRPAGGEEEKLGLVRHGVSLFRVLEEVADFLADLGAAGLTQDDDALAAGFEMLLKQTDLRGLAAAFRAFEGEQETGHGLWI